VNKELLNTKELESLT